MDARGPLALGLTLAGLGSGWWMRRRSGNRPWWAQPVEDLRKSGRDWPGDSSAWLGDVAGTAGSRLADVVGETRKGLGNIDLEIDGRRLRQRAGRLRRQAGETTADLGAATLPTAAEWGARAGETAADWGARAGELAAEIGGRAGELAAEIGDRAGDTAAELGARAGETAAVLGPTVGKLAAETGSAIDEVRSQAAGLAGAAVGGATQLAFRTVRDLAILGLAGGVILYLYAPEREQQQELLETAQGVAFGAADFGRGVKQLVDDLRAT